MTTHRSVTDGLALVAYSATARLREGAARYAWTVVVTAAGLSGLAQATYLAGGPAVEVDPALRFGVGAWPAVAAAVVAHLLYLLAAAGPPSRLSVHRDSVQPEAFNPYGVQPDLLPSVVQPSWASGGEAGDPDSPGDATGDTAQPGPASRPAPSPARDRAEAAASRHAQRHGTWPTVSELETAAEVSRGTAAAALKALRDRPLPLHLINNSENDPTDEAQP